MELGIDISSYFETLDLGAKYYQNGIEVNPLELFKKQGVSTIRIRLWVNPYSEDGKPYLAGTCDLNNFIKLAKYCQNLGFDIYLDFHYSDFWTDPKKQFKPKSWSSLSGDALISKLYQYTLDTLKEIKNNNIDLKMIQVGNEITGGMLWPDGEISRNGFAYLSKLLKAGFMAVEQIYPKAIKIIHLERSFDKDMYDYYLTNLEKNEVKYDMLAASYYPFWHLSFEDLFNNLNHCKNKFNKQIMIAETSYVFTEKDYLKEDVNQLVVNENNFSDECHKLYPFTKEGQANYIKDFLNLCKENGVYMVCYWEPLWVPANLTSWASKEAIEYIKSDKKTTRNEWANNCLVDYDGNFNPAFYEYKK